MSKLFTIKNLHVTKISPVKDKMKKIKVVGDPISIGKSESQIEEEIVSWLKENNILYWIIKIKGDPILTRNGFRLKKNKNRGFGDIHCCYKGLSIYLEVKKYDGICSEKQIETQFNVRNKGNGIYEFVTSVREVKKIFVRLGLK